jgi:uncharacterized membrane protein YcfT
VPAALVPAALVPAEAQRRPPATAPGRTLWADAAKGLCILLVVLWHVVIKQYLTVDWRITAPVPGAWGTLGEQLLPLRMPLFFTISGMFAVGAVNWPWRVLARSKVARFGYLYAGWLVIHTAVFAFTPDFDTAKAASVAQFVEQLTITPSNLWYLYALAAYFTIAKAVRRVPRTMVLVPALALSAAASAGLLATPGNRGGLYAHLVFFLGGLYFRPAIERLAANTSGRRVALAAAGYAGGLVAMAVAGAQAWPGVWPAVCVIATAFGVTAMAWIVRWAPLGAALAGIGRRTLPIYVMHMPLLAVLYRLLDGPMSGAGGAAQLLLAVVEPAAVTALLVWTCLVLHRGLERRGVTWLFDLPVRIDPRRPGRLSRWDGTRQSGAGTPWSR